MASSPDSTWNFFASLTLSTWHSAASLYKLLAWSVVRWGEDGPDVNTPAGHAGHAGHEIARACYWVSWEVEAWASIK